MTVEPTATTTNSTAINSATNSVTNSTELELDADELFHLGIKASEQSSHEQAITYFKRSLIKKDNANTRYLLGAQYAEIGMIERAIDAMTSAVSLEPELWTAHFQIGLAQMTIGHNAEALISWQPLEKLELSEPLRLFAEGLCALVTNELEKAQQKILQGIENNRQNPALNKDMSKVIENISTMIGGEKMPLPADEESSSKSHLFLNAYKS